MKRHYCTVPDCGKSFSRPSHLQRHALNHSNTQWNCNRCTASFKRLDLLERHKDRHATKDRRAGGAGLGILGTKKRFLSHPSAVHAESFSSVQSSLGRNDTSGGFLHKETLGEACQQAEHDDDGLDATGEIMAAIDCSLHPVNRPQSAIMSQVSSNGAAQHESTHNDPIGDMYHDLTFDLVHFNVTGFTTPRSDLYLPTDIGRIDHISNRPRLDPSLEISLDRPVYDVANTALSPGRGSSHTRITDPNNLPETRRRLSLVYSPTTTVHQAQREFRLPENHSSLLHRTSFTSPFDRLTNTPSPSSTTAHDKPLIIAIPPEKRAELVELIAEIRPVRPNGSLINGDSPEFSLTNMQTYLDSFVRHFNTSYPILHVPTLDVCNLDPISLLSFIIMGATYKDKHAHQLSVCLYDAIIPYIFSGLLSSMVPDLAILQAFMVLECYGMYRAGPYQRENAILIHRLLLNSISRVSRYHVRACIALPSRLAHTEKDWFEFAYAEQYKRLILFFFMWDTQNAACYSFMPNMSTQSLQIGLPCSKQSWEARTEPEWKASITESEESYTFLGLVEEFIDSTYQELSKSFDTLGFSLALHGLMSMCNDIILFDSRSRYFTMLKTQESIWSAGREQMAYALSSWKAKYEAFAMDALRDMATEHERGQFLRDNTGLYALYHTAHIVINCEIRHLQVAAGAKAIFGHLVTPSDFQDSCNWVREWLHSSSDSAGRAAWHAALLFREGMLGLKNWDVHGVFHYPWCLYIATLTLWVFHHFGAEAMDSSDEEHAATTRAHVCDHKSTPARIEDIQKRSRSSMNHLVATMASVTPAYMNVLMGKCCTHGLTIEMAKFLRSIRWTAAYEAMKVLEGLSGLPVDAHRASL